MILGGRDRGVEDRPRYQRAEARPSRPGIFGSHRSKRWLHRLLSSPDHRLNGLRLAHALVSARDHGACRGGPWRLTAGGRGRGRAHATTRNAHAPTAADPLRNVLVGLHAADARPVECLASTLIRQPLVGLGCHCGRNLPFERCPDFAAARTTVIVRECLLADSYEEIPFTCTARASWFRPVIAHNVPCTF